MLGFHSISIVHTNSIVRISLCECYRAHPVVRILSIVCIPLYAFHVCIPLYAFYRAIDEGTLAPRIHISTKTRHLLDGQLLLDLSHRAGSDVPRKILVA